MSASVFQPGAGALITGGASGIGLALAKLCREKGMNVFVVDRDTDALQKASSELGNDGVTTFSGDVSKLDDWREIQERANKALGSVQLLALNAGTAVKSTWGDHEAFQQTLNVNLFGILNGVNTLLPQIKESAEKEGKPSAIVITGSKQGITNPPGNPAYNASKAAVKTAAEHLSYDLRNTKGLSVHLLVPGFTFTGLIQKMMGTTEKPASAWTSEQVVDYLYKKMQEGKFYVICPDNDVSEELDKKRMLWSVGDIIQQRPPLTRWREEWKKEAEEAIAKTQV